MKKSIMAVVLAGALAASGIMGCGKTEKTPTTEAETTTTTAAVETTAAEEEKLDYSKGIANNGFIEGLKCLDYVTLPDFTALSFKRADIERSEAGIEEDIAALAQLFEPEQITDRAIEDQDKVNIDYTGYMDGEAFDRGAATDSMVTAGSQEFIDDFLTQIIGHKAGEEFDVNVTFPDPYPNNPDFAGRDATFVVKINYIAEYPELTDEWIKGHLDTVKEVLGIDVVTDRQSLYDYIYDYYYEDGLKQAIYEYINAEGNVVVSEVPEEAYNVAANIINAEMVRQYGQTLESVMDTEGDEVREMIEGDAKSLMIYQAIAEQQGWDKVTAGDLVELTGEKDNAARIEAYGIGYLAQTLLYYRAYDYIAEIVTIED